MTGAEPASATLRDTRRHAIVGGGIIAALLFAVVLVAASARIDSAVVATGSIAVVDGAQQVAHPTGGVVATIAVRAGDRVREGDPLFELDATSLDLATKHLEEQLFAVSAAITRLDAESNSTWSFEPPTSAIGTIDAAFVDGVISRERALMELQHNLLAGAQEQIDLQIEQTNSDQASADATRVALNGERSTIEAEVAGLRPTPVDVLTTSRISTLDNRAAAIERELTSLDATVERLGRSVELQTADRDQADAQARTQAMVEATGARQRHAELQRELDAALLDQSRLIVRAPTDGVVHESAVVTQGGVVAPEATVLTIIPENSSASVDARIQPSDIASVQVGDTTRLVFPAFDRLNAPELTGQVLAVSPMTVTDPVTGEQYYRATIGIGEDPVSRLPEGAELTPGMAADVYVSTGERTVLDYLLSPLLDRLDEALQEE